MGPQRCASSSSENMKAQAVLCLVLLIGLASSHSLSKRSLLKGSSHGHGHHQHHHQRRFQGRRQHQRQSATGSRRTGRDGDHHDHDDSHGEVRAISTGYLPADDYEDDLAGYGASSRSDNLPGYSGSEDYSDQSQYGSDQSQYGASERDSQPEYEETTTTAPDLARDADGESANDQYGAPSNIDNSYAAPDGEYGAPDSDSEGSGADESGVDVARSTDSDYSAPDTEYGSPDSSNSRSQLDGDYELRHQTIPPEMDSHLRPWRTAPEPGTPELEEVDNVQVAVSRSVSLSVLDPLSGSTELVSEVVLIDFRRQYSHITPVNVQKS